MINPLLSKYILYDALIISLKIISIGGIIGLCIYLIKNRLNSTEQILIDKQNTSNISFEDRQKIICNYLSNEQSSEEIRNLIKKWIPQSYYFTFFANGKTYYERPSTIIDDKGTHEMVQIREALFYNKTHLIFLFEINLILEKLVKNNILFFWHDKDRIGENEPLTLKVNQTNKNTIKNIPSSLNSKILFSILTNQYFINEEKLNKFIENKYKTDDEIKESRDNKLYVIAIIAIIVPIITVALQFIQNK